MTIDEIHSLDFELILEGLSILVSVYIPTFNRCALLERAVNSVLSQTYGNIELIIVDDCSCDGTLEYLQQLALKDNRVKYIVNSNNSGACISRNKAIIKASGNYITGLDDDDYFLDDRIQNFINFVAVSGSPVVFSNYLLRLKSGQKQKKLKPKYVYRKNLPLSNYIGNQVFCDAALLKRTLFDPSLKKLQDLDCWYRLTENNYACNTLQFDYVIDHSHPHERISASKNTSQVIEYLNVKYAVHFDLHILNYKQARPGLIWHLKIACAPSLKDACVILLKFVYFLILSLRRL